MNNLSLQQAVDQGYQTEGNNTLLCVNCGSFFKSFWDEDDCDFNGVSCECQECSNEH